MKSLVAAAVVLAACGGEHQHIHPDATADAPPDSSAPSNVCDYTEQHDATNDDVSSNAGMPEATNLTLGSKTTICGTIDASHFDGDITVDIDGFTIAVVSDTDVLVRIAGGAGLETIELVGVDIYGGAGLSTRVGANTFYGDHGVTALHLAPGMYELIPFALNSTAITSSVAYKVEVIVDNPATRCVELTSGGHAEGSGANDVIAFPSGAPPMLTADTADSAETTNILLGASARITGSATDIAQDNYEDRDAFTFSTTSTTNEATVKLTWSGAANLDFFVFEANSAEPITRATATTAGSETAVLPLKAGAPYWFLVGAKSITGLPATYSATLCGGTY